MIPMSRHRTKGPGNARRPPAPAPTGPSAAGQAQPPTTRTSSRPTLRPPPPRHARTARRDRRPGPHGAPRGETFAVPVGTRARHWPDLVVVREDGLLIAVEVELTPKPKASLGRILRAYIQARRKVLYVPTGPVTRLLQGRPGPDGRGVDGVAQDVGLLPAGEPVRGAGGLLLVRPFTADDPGVARGRASRRSSLQPGVTLPRRIRRD